MILKHRNRELLKFDWIKPFGVRNVELNNAELQYLPLEFRDKARKGVTRDLIWCLEDWLLHRTAPVNRHFVRDVLASSGFNPSNPNYHRQLLEFCLGLSLNDVHWIVPDDYKTTWEDNNLYQNDFPESIATLAFSGMGRIRQEDLSTSPEYTTNGVLAKCWRRNNGAISLWKSGSEKSLGLEPYAEFYASQIAKQLDIPFTPYKLARFKNRICSVCPLFTNENHGFIPAGKLITREQISTDNQFADIFLLDAIILNDDRHLGNLGFLIDNDTNEISGIAPAFDNGHSFFARPPERFADCSPALYDNWLDFPGCNQDKIIERIYKLKDFKLKKSPRFNLPSKHFQSAKTFLEHRITELVRHFDKAPKGGPVNVEFTGPALILHLVKNNPGLRKKALASLSGLTERTTKRYLSQLKGKVIFKGAPKTGGYYAC